MTRIIVIAIVAMVLASTLAPAHAAFTNQEWLDHCASSDLGRQGLCAAYANGVFDAMMLLQVLQPGTATTCFPSPQPTGAQVRDVGIAHIRKAIADFPGTGEQLPAVLGLRAAFLHAWPCPSRRP